MDYFTLAISKDRGMAVENSSAGRMVQADLTDINLLPSVEYV
jgi:hypothetical protein